MFIQQEPKDSHFVQGCLAYRLERASDFAISNATFELCLTADKLRYQRNFNSSTYSELTFGPSQRSRTYIWLESENAYVIFVTPD